MQRLAASETVRCMLRSGCRRLPLWGRTSTFTARPVACSPRTKLSKTSCDRTASVPTNRPRDDSRAKINGGSHCRTVFTVATEPKPSHSVELRSPARHYPTDNDAWRSAEWRSAMSRAAASAAIPCVPRVVYSKSDVAVRMPCRAGSGSCWASAMPTVAQCRAVLGQCHTHSGPVPCRAGSGSCCRPIDRFVLRLQHVTSP